MYVYVVRCIIAVSACQPDSLILFLCMLVLHLNSFKCTVSVQTNNYRFYVSNVSKIYHLLCPCRTVA